MSPITLRLPGDTRSSNWVPAPKLFRCSSSSSSSSATRSSPNFFSFYSTRSSTRHLLASAQASSSILGFFLLFLSLLPCCDKCRSAGGAPKSRARRSRSNSSSSNGRRERERETKLLHGRPGWLRKDEALPRAPELARPSSAGARARSRGRTGERADGRGGGVWDPVPGNWNQQQQRVSGTNPPAQ